MMADAALHLNGFGSQQASRNLDPAGKASQESPFSKLSRARAAKLGQARGQAGRPPDLGLTGQNSRSLQASKSFRRLASKQSQPDSEADLAKQSALGAPILSRSSGLTRALIEGLARGDAARAARTLSKEVADRERRAANAEIALSSTKKHEAAISGNDVPDSDPMKLLHPGVPSPRNRTGKVRRGSLSEALKKIARDGEEAADGTPKRRASIPSTSDGSLDMSPSMAVQAKHGDATGAGPSLPKNAKDMDSGAMEESKPSVSDVNSATLHEAIKIHMGNRPHSAMASFRGEEEG